MRDFARIALGSIALTALTACGSESMPVPEAGPGEDFSVTLVDETLSDTPIRTSVEQHFAIEGVPSAEGLKAEMQRRFMEAMARAGFRHRGSPEAAYLYFYASEEQAKAGLALWVGMIAKGPSDARSSETVNESRLALLSNVSEERFGFSEEERRTIFHDLLAAEDRAEREARSRVPDSDWERQIDLERNLADRYKAEIRVRWEIDEETIRGITVEGVTSGWVG